MTKIGEYNHAIGGEPIIRDMTKEEIAEHKETQAAFKQESALEAAKAQAKAALLERLGITEEEVTLLLA